MDTADLAKRTKSTKVFLPGFCGWDGIRNPGPQLRVANKLLGFPTKKSGNPGFLTGILGWEGGVDPRYGILSLDFVKHSKFELMRLMKHSKNQAKQPTSTRKLLLFQDVPSVGHFENLADCLMLPFYPIPIKGGYRCEIDAGLDCQQWWRDEPIDRSHIWSWWIPSIHPKTLKTFWWTVSHLKSSCLSYLTW